MEPEARILASMSDGALHRMKHAARHGRRQAERVWELALRLDPYSELARWGQQETARWDRLHALVKAECARRRRRSC